jgi:ApbE superfamily uncharacterized protein (UPF0280 family)
MGEGRFTTFTTGYKDTDLWIGIDTASYLVEMKSFCLEKIRIYRMELENYLIQDPKFGNTLSPWKTLSSAPELAQTMAIAASRAGVGPMAAVAGAFSEKLGQDLLSRFAIQELAIENGGDIFLFLTESLILSVYAGKDPLSGKVGIELPKKIGKIGVCTSAGKVGPSLSFGKADAVMVACRETAQADAWATALGNRIQTSDDIDEVLKFSENYHEILSVVIICDGKLGIRGDFDLKIIA